MPHSQTSGAAAAANESGRGRHAWLPEQLKRKLNEFSGPKKKTHKSSFCRVRLKVCSKQGKENKQQQQWRPQQTHTNTRSTHTRTQAGSSNLSLNDNASCELSQAHRQQASGACGRGSCHAFSRYLSLSATRLAKLFESI